MDAEREKGDFELGEEGPHCSIQRGFPVEIRSKEFFADLPRGPVKQAEQYNDV